MSDKGLRSTERPNWGVTGPSQHIVELVFFFPGPQMVPWGVPH